MLLGEGGYGVVYRGQLPDGTLVAVKNLRNNKSVKPSLSLQFFYCSQLFPNSPPDRHAESVIGMYGYTEIETQILWVGGKTHTLKKLRKSWIH
jgi:serine/threonine protein kinase